MISGLNLLIQRMFFAGHEQLGHETPILRPVTYPLKEVFLQRSVPSLLFR